MAKRGKTNINAGKGGKQIFTKMEEVDIKTYEDAEKLMEVIRRITIKDFKAEEEDE